MENDIWELVRATLQWAIFPCIAAIAYFVRKYIGRVDLMESRVSDLEVRTSVIESKIDDIRDDVKDVKRGIEKLLDRL